MRTLNALENALKMDLNMPFSNYFCLIIPIICSLAIPSIGQAVSQAKLTALYNSLDPTSISMHLAFYDLYSDSPQGQVALKHACQLLSGGTQDANDLILPHSMQGALQAIVGLVNKYPTERHIDLTEDELRSIHQLARRLPNRLLKGYFATSEEEVLALNSDQIDLARGMLLSQLGNDPESLHKIKSYEAMIDLMALQILARITLKDSPKIKIQAINRFIFDEMGFRFPPESASLKDIDFYTFLPSVLDSRRGVCLGVSILYICLAQRLNLTLEIVTPPGHIYVRWRGDHQEINIETTARGLDVPSEKYLGIDTRALWQRDVKETIGLAHCNQAAVFCKRQQYDKALKSYLKAKPYLPNDKLLKSFMAFIYLLEEKLDEAKPLLQELLDYIPDEAVSKETLFEDYLNGAVSKEGMQAIFMQTDDSRESLVVKRETLEAILKKYPRFREGYLSLATTWMQLNRPGDALKVLQQYHEIDSNNASVEYCLAELYIDRLDFNKAWKHLRLTEKLTKERDHHPKVLFSLRQKLAAFCPE